MSTVDVLSDGFGGEATVAFTSLRMDDKDETDSQVHNFHRVHIVEPVRTAVELHSWSRESLNNSEFTLQN